MTKLLKLGALFVCATALTSCLSNETNKVSEHRASFTEVGTAMAEIFNADPLAMRKGDFLFTETEQTLDTQAPRLYLQEGVTIIDKTKEMVTPTTRRWNYAFAYQTKLYSGNTPQASTREASRYAEEDLLCSGANPDADCPATATASVMNQLRQTSASIRPLATVKNLDMKTFADDLQMSLGVEKAYSLIQQCAKPDGLDKYCQEQFKAESCDLYCSNLKVWEETRTPPDLIKDQENCGGLPDCKLKVKIIKFDSIFEVKTPSAIEKQKISYHIALSPDLPYLSKLVELCQRGLIQIDSSKLLVTICSKVKNFERGPTP